MAHQLKKEFETFEMQRRNFARMIAESASRAENLKILNENRVLFILHPLLLDDVPGIQQSAALAIGRLANYDERIAEDVVNHGILNDIVRGLSSEDLVFQRSSCFVIRTVARHSAELAEKVVQSNVLGHIVNCLQSYDSKVRDAAIQALGSISTHNSGLANSVVSSQAVPFLITAAQGNEQSLKRMAILALGEIAKHDLELAKYIINAKGVKTITPLLKETDPKLKTAACSTLAHISKHSVETANLVVDSGIFPESLLCLKDSDYEVRKSAATLIREIVKHTQELSQRVVTEGGSVALVQYLKPDQGNDPLFGVMAIGYIASFSQSLATVLLQCGAADVCLNVFVQSKHEQTRAAAAWTLGQLGKHTSDTAATLAKLNVLSLLLDGHNKPDGSNDLVVKTERALQLIISKCTIIESLEPLIDKANENPSCRAILEVVLEQIAKLLPKNPKMRVPFVESGGFTAVQKVEEKGNQKIAEHKKKINSCYPEQAVKYYSPNYSQDLLKEIQQSFG